MGQSIRSLAKTLPDTGESTEVGREPFLRLRFDATGEDGGCTLRTDGNGNGIAVHDCGGDEIAVIEIIDDIDQRPGGMADPCDTGILRHILIRAVDQHGAERVPVVDPARDEMKSALPGPSRNLSMGVGSVDNDPGFGLEQETQLCNCGIPGTGHDNAPTA
jgi:hypothetical protein